MKLSKTQIQVLDPNTQNFIMTVLINSARAALQLANPAALTDNSGGIVGAGLTPIPTQLSAIQRNGASLASLAALNTAIGKINNAQAVLATYINMILLAMGHDVLQIVLNNGVVTTPGTIVALDRAIAPVDGSGGNAVLRAEANSALVTLRNNFSVLVKAYNVCAVGLGVASIPDTSGGSTPASPAYNLVIPAPASTPVVATAVASSDLADAQTMSLALIAFANDIATLAAKITTVLVASRVKPLGAVLTL